MSSSRSSNDNMASSSSRLIMGRLCLICLLLLVRSAQGSVNKRVLRGGELQNNVRRLEPDNDGGDYDYDPEEYEDTPPDEEEEEEETPAPTPEPDDEEETPAPTAEPEEETPAPAPVKKTPAPTPEPDDEEETPAPAPKKETPAPAPEEETAAPTPEPDDEDTPEPTAGPEETPAPAPEETPAPAPEETPAPAPKATPEPTEEVFDNDDKYDDDEEYDDDDQYVDEEEEGWGEPPTEKPVEYIPKDDDAVVIEDEEGLGAEEGPYWNEHSETAEEMMHDRNVIIVVGSLVGFFLFLMIVTAQQMKENPDGCWAACCRCAMIPTCCIIRCVCFPCRMICGCGKKKDHEFMGMNGNGEFREHDLDLAIS